MKSCNFNVTTTQSGLSQLIYPKKSIINYISVNFYNFAHFKSVFFSSDSSRT